MARKFTKISAKAFESMQINAGVVLNKFDPSGTTEIQDADIICATSGGVTAECKPNITDLGDDVDNCQKNTAELMQIGYINDYNGDANRIYDGNAVARALKAEAGGGGCEDRMVQRQCSFSVIGRVLPASGKLHQNQEVYDASCDSGGGISPTIKASHYKDPPKIRV